MSKDIKSLGEDARKTLDVGRLTGVRDWSRYHEESEWSLIISLIRPLFPAVMVRRSTDPA